MLCSEGMDVKRISFFMFQTFFSPFRTRLLLLNTFDLPEDNITIDNVLISIEKLSTAYPDEYAKLAYKLTNCSLEEELERVGFLSLLSKETHS